MKYIEKLQYITHDLPEFTAVEQVQLACEAGAKWIQYRCLSKTDDALLQDINAIAEICDDWGTTLIVTDHVHLHGKADIQGFHMEDLDADFIALRRLVGGDITLGGSASTVEGLMRLVNEGVDYIIYGPFSTTGSKPNNDPLIGFEGYANLMDNLEDLNLQIPVLAAGGIKLSDVDGLLQTGIFGIAVSGAINCADDFVGAYQEFYEAVKL
ncbi:thiamine phosphate synthase [Pedobacter frigidisoli]|uniref:thiamine phosphate synthase n=1 Tax=Pedobacter frigidisoli TaxID=2530455 RepID=UPI002931E508|nr:thiamine phosphate synthase [Pedobacter frigidisoli]